MTKHHEERQPNPQKVGKIMGIIRKLQADDDLDADERKLVRTLGLMPSATWLDTLTGGLARDFEHLFACAGGHNKVYGATNAAVKSAALAFGGYKLWRYLTT